MKGMIDGRPDPCPATRGPEEGRGVKFGRKPKLTAQQVTHARKLIDAGERREDVAGLLNVTGLPFIGRRHREMVTRY